MVDLIPKDVPGLDVTMHDVNAVEKDQCFEHLGQYRVVERGN